MKRGKAIGEDGLPVEVVSAAGENAMGQLLKVMQIVYRIESVPERWQKGVINPIFKKGKKRNARTTEV